MAVVNLALSSFTKGLLLSTTPSIPRSSSSSSSILPTSSSISPSSPPPLRSSWRRHLPRPLPREWRDSQGPQPQPQPQPQQQQHMALLVETYQRNNSLRALLRALAREGSSPVDLLKRDGDWSKDQLWAAIAFLIGAGRAKEALQVFGSWKDKAMIRINNANYSKIIRLLCEGSFMQEAVSTFQDMKKYGLIPSLAIYNSIMHGFALKKDFDNSKATFENMLEAGLFPTTETYNGLIRAYGSYALYDEMIKCVKKMESEGCHPNEVTYNVLIAEFARGGLLERMERVYRTLLSKRMNLLPSTLVIMLEAYADLELLEKMEIIYRRVLNSKAYMKESLIKKVATVYIKHYRFSRLEELANDISNRDGRTDLFWCILLLSSACLLSQKGIESITREMKAAEARPNITYINILLLFYLKMKDFAALDAVFSQARKENVKPDIVSVGILFDACKIGFDGIYVIEEWKRKGFLEEAVETKTDHLVLTAFGKGFFLKTCERLYSSLEFKERKEKHWRYRDLITLVFGKENNQGKVQSVQIK